MELIIYKYYRVFVIVIVIIVVILITVISNYKDYRYHYHFLYYNKSFYEFCNSILCKETHNLYFMFNLQIEE